MSTPCIAPPAGHWEVCKECEGDGFVFIATQWWGDDEERCPSCSGAKQVWIKAPAVHDTVPAPAPDGCTEAAE